MESSTAPGKAFLFGEHAVVYGEPAVTCAIDRRMEVTIDSHDDGGVLIDFPAVSLKNHYVDFEFGGDDPAEVADERSVEYVLNGLEKACEAADVTGVGLEIRVEGDLPISAGLGSSAAGTVASIHATVRELGGTIAREDLAERAYRVEYEVQGGASRADTFCATMGGAVRVEGDDCATIQTPDLPLVVGYDGQSGETRALVEAVRQRRDRHMVVARTMEAIGDVVREGEQLLSENSVESVGELMDVNHGLLSALGVSTASLDKLAWAARNAGAYGAKLTGAGGGGCVVALDPSGQCVSALQKSPTSEAAFRAPLDRDGVRAK